jgi:hypothetical protein
MVSTASGTMDSSPMAVVRSGSRRSVCSYHHPKPSSANLPPLSPRPRPGHCSTRPPVRAAEVCYALYPPCRDSGSGKPNLVRIRHEPHCVTLHSGPAVVSIPIAALARLWPATAKLPADRDLLHHAPGEATLTVRAVIHPHRNHGHRSIGNAGRRTTRLALTP